MIQTDAGLEPVGFAPMQGREMRSIGLHALAAAVMYVSPLLLFVPAAFISSGLRHGRRGVIGSIAGSTLILGLVTLILGGAQVTLVTGLLRLVMTVGIPAAVATAMIRRSVRSGSVLLTSLVLSTGGFLLVEGMMSATMDFSPYGAIVEELRSATEPTLAMYRQMGVSATTLEAMSHASAVLVNQFVPSLLIIITAMMFVFSLVMIPRLPWGRSASPSLLFRSLQLPDLLLFGFVFGGISPLMRGGWQTAGWNVLVVVSFLYVLQGLAIYRAIVLRLGFRAVGNVMAWGLLLILMLNGVGLFLVFLAGLFDPFFDFRKFKSKGESDESDSD